MASQLFIQISVGELLDRLGIWELKVERADDPIKRGDLEVELRMLAGVARSIGISVETRAAFNELKAINVRIWDLETEIRRLILLGGPDDEFITTAKAIHRLNDERSKVKRVLNQQIGESLVDHKTY